jgi:hypothetical protein
MLAYPLWLCYFLIMPTKHQNLIARCRAFALLVIVCFGSFVSPLTLAMPQLNGCTMECCEEEGYCCCVAGRWANLQEQSRGEDIPTVNEWQSLCGSNCATAQVATNSFSFVPNLETVAEISSYEATQTNLYQSRIEHQEYLRLKKSSPRAPPVFS